jgi:hypothetical protein
MKIHRRIIATEVECSWSPCRQCGQRFELHEILTCVDLGGNAPMFYWVCETCMDLYFGHLLQESWRTTWRVRRQDGSREEVDWNKAG